MKNLLSSRKRLPNLLCIGVEKCGTTLLNALFATSPDILTPTKKELFFINQNFDQGTDWYHQWFDYSSKPKAKYICDVTPSYFRSELSMLRIQLALGKPKIIVALRHPVYRAYSHYVHRLRHVAPALDCHTSSFFDEFYTGQVKGLLFPKYQNCLRFLPKYFSTDNILLLNYDTDLKNPAILQKKLEDFLNIKLDSVTSILARKVNDGTMPCFYHRDITGPEISIGDDAYRLPENTLILAHNKGSRSWPNIDLEKAKQNIEASASWTRSLNELVIENLYRQRFEADCEELAKQWNFDIEPWLKMANPVQYQQATPLIQDLTPL